MLELIVHFVCMCVQGRECLHVCVCVFLLNENINVQIEGRPHQHQATEANWKEVLWE
jgi:hypothetical protein